MSKVGVCVAAAWCLMGAAAWAQGAAAGSIYSCVDAKGRRLTSDRPIPECIDREQRELNSSGTTKRVVGPTLTAQERIALEEKQKAQAEEKLRLLEEKRRDRAMLSRYPNRAAHDKERNSAVAQVDEVIKAAAKRVAELTDDRKALDAELEFYKKDPSKVPGSLKRRVDETERAADVQKRFIADQELEKKRVHLRFDEELIRLKQLWALAAPATGSTNKTTAVAKTR
jgi:Domain of unknown function (DUF4124)